MLYISLVCASALLFFVLIPGLGALAVRGRWRRFRTRVMASIDNPVFHPGRVGQDPEYRQNFRFFGILEAVDDNDRLWLRDNYASVLLKVRHCPIFLMPGDVAVTWDTLFTNSMRSLRWEATGVLPEGMAVFVCGSLSMEGGLPCFGGKSAEPPLVIFYEGDSKTVMARAIWYGRQRNEYWNDVSPLSFLTGFAGLLSLAFFGFQDEGSRFAAVLAAGLSFIPFLPLMPPGIAAFFVYRRLWRKGRTLRARRDLGRLQDKLTDSQVPDVLPLQGLGRLPESQIKATTARIRWLETSSVLILFAGIIVNLYIVLRLIIQLFNKF